MLILVRHGQTAANAEGRLQGRVDLPLNELGTRQAALVAAAVGIPARVIASPLTRAHQTAAAFGLPVEVDERWVELDYGDFDGLPLGDVPPEVWRAWRDDPSWAPPGGESLTDVGSRVRAACADLAGEAAESDIVVVSHVSPIKAAVAWALQADDGVAWRLHLGVAAICRVSVAPGGPVLRSFNEQAHLGVGSLA